MGKESEQLLVEEAHLSLITKNAANMIYIMSVENGRHRYCSINPAAVEFGGFQEEWIGLIIEEVCPADQIQPILEIYRSVAATRRPVIVTDHFPLPNGKVVIEALVAPLFNRSGECSRLVVICQSADTVAQQLGANSGLTSIVHTSPDAILTSNKDGVFNYCNEAFEAMFGYSAEEIIGLRLIEAPIHISEDRDEYEDIMARLSRGEIIRNYNTVRKKKDGTPVHVAMSVKQINDENNEMKSLTAIYRDITERIRQEEADRQRESNYRIVTENMTDLIAILDQNEHILFASPSYEKILGVAPDQLIGQSVADFIHPDDFIRLRSIASSILASGETRSVEFRQRNAGGDWSWMEVTLTPLNKNGLDERFLWVCRDLTERRRTEEQVAHMAFYDTVTGAANMRLFKERLDMAILTAKRYKHIVGLLYVNLDDFRFINQSYGSETGDTLLKEVVQRISGCVREKGSVGRMAGDEFTVILHDLEKREDALLVAHRVIERVGQPFEVEGNRIFITCSVGIAFYPDDCQESAQLIDSAHVAMYRAKEKGKSNSQLYEQK